MALTMASGSLAIGAARAPTDIAASRPEAAVKTKERRVIMKGPSIGNTGSCIRRHGDAQGSMSIESPGGSVCTMGTTSNPDREDPGGRSGDSMRGNRSRAADLASIPGAIQ